MSGCAINRTIIGCDTVKPIYVTHNDAKVVSNRLAKEIVSHNETFRELGCPAFQR